MHLVGLTIEMYILHLYVCQRNWLRNILHQILQKLQNMLITKGTASSLQQRYRRCTISVTPCCSALARIRGRHELFGAPDFRL